MHIRAYKLVYRNKYKYYQTNIIALHHLYNYLRKMTTKRREKPIFKHNVSTLLTSTLTN